MWLTVQNALDFNTVLVVSNIKGFKVYVPCEVRIFVNENSKYMLPFKIVQEPQFYSTRLTKG
jgi:hypothetical protein